MKLARNIIFILLCIAVGLGVGKAFLWFKERYYAGPNFSSNDRPPRQTGVGNAPDARGFFLRRLDPQALPARIEEWKSLYATSLTMEYGPEVSKETLARAASVARDAGFSLILLPPAPHKQNPYPRPLTQISQEAQDAGVDHLVIGWLDQDPDAAYWREQSKAVRAIFKGTVILAASHATALRTDCWDASDLIAIIGPIPFARQLPGAPEIIEPDGLRSAWSCTLAGLDSMADLHQKKLAFLRANVPLAVSHKLPPAGRPDEPSLNPSLQAMLYETLLLETKSKDSRIKILTFDWGGTGDVNAINTNRSLLKKVGEAWKPEPPSTQAKPETAPAEIDQDGG